MIRAFFFAALGVTATAAMAADPIYLDLNRSFEERAADLVSRMTLEEKVAQLQNDATAGDALLMFPTVSEELAVEVETEAVVGANHELVRIATSRFTTT